jgi:hypothetical protein
MFSAEDARALSESRPNEVLSGFFAPIVEVRQPPGKGRGIFAAENIPRGFTYIWSGAMLRGGKFEDGCRFQKVPSLYS